MTLILRNPKVTGSNPVLGTFRRNIMEEKEAESILEDRERIREIDRGDMLSTIFSLPAQLTAGIKAGNRFEIPNFRPKNIVACGMGGSAIAGEVTGVWLSERLPIPFFTNRNFNIPSFVSKDTLVFALSYSGNTYETLNMAEEALDRGAKVIAISSGGKLREMAESEGYFIDIPAGLQPRAAIGHLVSAMGSALKSLKIYDPDVEIISTASYLKELRERLTPSRRYGDNEAKRVAAALVDTTPVIYSYGPYVAAANRWHTQINENAKMLSFYGALTEIEHNEIVGWNDSAKGFSAVFLRGSESAALSAITEFDKEVIKSRGGRALDVRAEGEDSLKKIFSLIYKGDFVSYYLALLRGIDPTPVEIISELKGKVKNLI